jgi:hypothetical protein
MIYIFISAHDPGVEKRAKDSRGPFRKSFIKNASQKNNFFGKVFFSKFDIRYCLRFRFCDLEILVKSGSLFCPQNGWLQRLMYISLYNKLFGENHQK